MARGETREGPTPAGLRWLIGVRLLLTFVFLGSVTALRVWGALPVAGRPLFALLALTFGLSICYLLLLSQVGNLRRFAHVQIAIDLAIETALVHYSGGLASAFSFVYIFTIYAAAALLGRRESLLAASASSVLYGVLANLHYYGSLLGWEVAAGQLVDRHPGYAIFQVFVNIVAFFLVAVLSSHLAERLREAGRHLRERTRDLRQLQTLHRDIIANIPSGVMTMDLEGHIVSFNEAAQRITGYPVAAVCDRLWTESPFAACAELRSFLEAPGAVTHHHTFLEEIRRQDGRRIPLGVGLSPLRDEAGSILGLVVIFQDLTERRRLEEQLRQADRLATAGQLAAGIAHELRNPLAAISGCVQLLQGEDEAASRHQRLLEILLRETERLKLITGQFLDFARPRRMAPQPCPLVPLLGEVISLLEQSPGRHAETAITLEASRDGNLTVLADPDQLKQIFWNLGLNALDAMPRGGRLIIRAGTREDRGRPWGVVEFADSGGGIPAESVERVFDPFYTTKDRGTGLGLSIARKIAEGCGGGITLDNRPGEGATFRVSLPGAAEVPAVTAGSGMGG